MAHPKRKVSKTRRDKRRTHHKLEIPAMASCGNCGSTHLMHHICPDCGQYRGKQVIEVIEA
jgi:large subunit ribosomal protein L32